MSTLFKRLIERDQTVLIAIILWVSLDFLILGKYSRVLVGDEGDSVLSAMLSMAHMDGLRTLWSPFAVAGTDRLATTFFPELWSVLFHVLPGWLAYQIARVSIVAGGVIGIYLLCRNKFALSRRAGLFAALLAAIYFGDAPLYMMPVAFLPIVILVLGYLLKDMKSLRGWGLVGAVGVLYSITALPQFLILFAPVFAALWFLCIDGLYDFRQLHVWRKWAVIVLFFVFVYLLRSQEFFALFLNAPFSMRADRAIYNQTALEALGQGLGILHDALDPASLVSLWPYFGIKTPILAAYLALVVALATKLRDARLQRLLLLMMVCAALVVSMPVAGVLLYDVMPAIRGFSTNKLWAFALIATMPAAGLAYQALEARFAGNEPGNSSRDIRGWYRAAPFVFLLLFSVVEKGISMPREWITQGSFKQIYESPVIENLAESVKARGEPVRVASFQMYDTYVNAYGLESPGGQVDMYSKRYSEFWEKIIEFSINNDPSLKKYLLTGNTLELGHTYNKIEKLPERSIGDYFRLNLLSLANVGYILSRDRLLDPELKLVNINAPQTPWSALSVSEKVMTSLADNFRGRTHLYVYENKAVLPRYFLARQLRVLDNRADVLGALSKMSTSALRETAYIAKDDWPDAVAPPPYSAVGHVKLEKYGTDEIAFSTDLTGPSLLVVTNSFSPFWTCRINGIRAKIYPIDATFWGVELPKSAKSVTFSYEPPY